ncbi:hypothetical protein HPB48_021037 [Haemaphysalis longicornis]|uniref:Uncharacterized protein n=1 Tax=Haemaphysalis longicornis TaxID=44386 RepID=A0A9J6G8H9_HAELO|nr:hypothetical protein HPB48_021037 [Haemaphysalis longicornis]
MTTLCGTRVAAPATVPLWLILTTLAALTAWAAGDASGGAAGGAGATCRLQATSIRITRDHSDDQGSPVRTCEGTVLVSRCEGTCVSQVQPSITLPHGFLKVSTAPGVREAASTAGLAMKRDVRCEDA